LAALHFARLLAGTLVGLSALPVAALLESLVSLVAAALRAVALALGLLAAALLVTLVSLATLLVLLSGLVSLVVCHWVFNSWPLGRWGRHGPGILVQAASRVSLTQPL
jgi:hypothetical protein